MKHTRLMTLGAFLAVGLSLTAAQSTAPTPVVVPPQPAAPGPSVAEAARAARKNKAESGQTARHFDNDNLPTDGDVSVVGPSAADAKTDDAAKPAVDPAAAAAERQKVADQWKEKIEKQKAKIDAILHELDIDQRELRLRAAAVYSDPAVRGRDAADWDKKDEQFRDEIASKQKDLDEARKQLDDMQEEERKAGIKASGADTDTDKK